jgi:hypothetical protein
MFFTLVDKHKALIVPFVLEARYAENNPILGILDSVEEDSRAKQRGDRARHKNSDSRIAAAQRAIRDIGWVTRYEAGTWRATALQEKLVDVLRKRNYTIIPVGGEKDSLSTEEYLLERVFFELNFQASNSVRSDSARLRKTGHTHIRLAAASEDVLTGAIQTAWTLRVEQNAKTSRKRHKKRGKR